MTTHPWLTDTPFTQEQVDRFNRLTHFPRTLEAENRRFLDLKKEITEATLAKLKRFGQPEIPPEVQSCVNWLLKAYYEYEIAMIRSRELSPPWTVTGRANYSKVFTERKQRQSRNTEENAHRQVEKAKEKLRLAINRLSPNAAISSDDPNAIEKLREKLKNCQEMQILMKEANKIVRAKKPTDEEKASKLNDLFMARNWREKTRDRVIQEILHPQYGRPGFAAFQLSNNNAEIRRLEERIKSLEKMQGDETKEWEFEGFTVTDNVEDNRLQIFFDGKPDEEIRSKLKSNGFKWAPSVGAWQRQRSEAAKWKAEHVLGVGLK